MAAGPDVSHGMTPSGSAAFLGQELKYNPGLDVIFRLMETLSLWSIDPRLCP